MIGGGTATPRGRDGSVILFPLTNRIQSPELRDLYHYWVALRVGRQMPSRHDVDPAEIADTLPLVGLLEVERNPLRFLYTFVGSAITAAFGRELTGRYLDELDLGRMGLRDEAIVREVLVTGVPSHIIGTVERRNGWQLRQEYVALPLTAGGGMGETYLVDMILVGQKWEVVTPTIA